MTNERLVRNAALPQNKENVMEDERSLDTAWRECVAALPEGWSFLVWRTMSGDELGYGIEATLDYGTGEDRDHRVEFVHGLTLAAAFHNLAARLTGRQAIYVNGRDDQPTHTFPPERERVMCGEGCEAFLEPGTPAEFRSAWLHWREHELDFGCSHGR